LNHCANDKDCIVAVVAMTQFIKASFPKTETNSNRTKNHKESGKVNGLLHEQSVGVHDCCCWFVDCVYRVAQKVSHYQIIKKLC